MSQFDNNNNWAQNDSRNYANQVAAQQGFGLGQRGVTEAESKLLDAVIETHQKHLREGIEMHGSISDAVRSVLLERLPAEYEQSLRAACERHDAAVVAMVELEAKHPLGPSMGSKIRKELRAKRGAE